MKRKTKRASEKGRRRKRAYIVFEINKWKNEAIKEKAFGRVRKSSCRASERAGERWKASDTEGVLSGRGTQERWRRAHLWIKPTSISQANHTKHMTHTRTNERALAHAHTHIMWTKNNEWTWQNLKDFYRAAFNFSSNNNTSQSVRASTNIIFEQINRCYSVILICMADISPFLLVPFYFIFFLLRRDHKIHFYSFICGPFTSNNTIHTQ